MDGRGGMRPWIRVWFLLDGIVALAPPLYWWADGRKAPIFGLPAALVYFLAVDLLIAASLVAAFLAERPRGLRS